MRCPSRSGLLLLCGVLALLLGCTQEPPPLPPVPNAAEDLSTWSVPELVQPPAPPPEPVPEPVAPKNKPQAAELLLEYAPSTTFSLTVPVGAPLDIVLQQGEQVRNLCCPPGGDQAATDQPHVARWDLKEGADGMGETLRHHIFAMATHPGMRTGLIVTTTLRTYLLTLTSVQKSPVRSVRWKYPHDPAATPLKPKEPGLLPDPAEPKRYHTGYSMTSSQQQAPEWLPRGVYDDGKKMYIVYPEIVLFQVVPMIRMVSVNGPQLLNVRQYLNVAIVDQLAPRLELRVGLDASAEVVTITRGNLRTIQCGPIQDADAACPVWPVAASKLVR